MDGLHVISYYARGLGDAVKRREVFQYFRDRNADIIIVQESHSTVKMEKMWRKEWGGSIFYSHSDSNSRGVCTVRPA